MRRVHALCVGFAVELVGARMQEVPCLPQGCDARFSIRIQQFKLDDRRASLVSTEFVRIQYSGATGEFPQPPDENAPLLPAKYDPLRLPPYTVVITYRAERIRMLYEQVQHHPEFFCMCGCAPGARPRAIDERVFHQATYGRMSCVSSLATAARACIAF